MRKIIFLLLITSAAIVFFIGCEADNPASIYNANKKGNATPVLTKLLPEDSTLAGIGEITIQGQNFSPIAENNLVYFDKTQTKILSATESEIRIQSPNILGDTIKIKIAVQGTYLYSNIMEYKLVAAVLEYGGFDGYDDAYGIACDKDENLYVFLSPKKVVKVTPGVNSDGGQGIQQDYGATSFVKASAMKMGADGYLYLARTSKSMYRIPSGGGDAVKWTSAPGKIYDFDFSETGVMYAGGKNDDLYRIYPDGSGIAIASYPDVYIKAVRVYNSYVYVGGEENTSSRQYVWRNEIISDDSLGERELYFDWSSTIDPISDVLSITFAADGDMYVGTNAAEAIIIVHSDASYETLYPGVLQPESYALIWGEGQYLYVCRRNLDASKKRIIRLFMAKDGAPYYGRQ